MSDAGHLSALGFQSRREADRFARDIEKLRNHLAHAQELEAEDLAVAVRLASIIDSIMHAEGVRRMVEEHRKSVAAKSRATTPP